MATAARLFCVQGSWNYERLQGIGAAVAVEPLLRDLPGGSRGEAYRRAMARAAKYFNTHPYLAGLALGAVARAEHAGVPGERIERLRAILKGPLGSVGDRLIWGAALPFASAVAVALASLDRPVAGVLAFLVLFNVPHLFLRIWGLSRGWALGMTVAKALGNPMIRAGMRLGGQLAAVAVGVAIPLAWHWMTQGLPGSAKLGTIGVAAVGMAVARWLAPTVGAARFAFATLVLVLTLGWLWT